MKASSTQAVRKKTTTKMTKTTRFNFSFFLSFLHSVRCGGIRKRALAMYNTMSTRAISTPEAMIRARIRRWFRRKCLLFEPLTSLHLDALASRGFFYDERPEFIESAIAVRDGILHRFIHLRVCFAVTLGLKHRVPVGRACLCLVLQTM